MSNQGQTSFEAPVYREVQRYQSKLLAFFLFGFILMAIYLTLLSVLPTVAFAIAGEKVRWWAGIAKMIIPAFITIILVIGPMIVRMVTEVRRDGLYYRLQPFPGKWRSLSWSQVSGYEIVTVDWANWIHDIIFFRERHHRFMAMNSKYALAIRMKNGALVILGSNKVNDLAAAIDTARNSFDSRANSVLMRELENNP